jgi:hypothetical protein
MVCNRSSWYSYISREWIVPSGGFEEEKHMHLAGNGPLLPLCTPGVHGAHTPFYPPLRSCISHREHGWMFSHSLLDESDSS